MSKLGVVALVVVVLGVLFGSDNPLRYPLVRCFFDGSFFVLDKLQQLPNTYAMEGNFAPVLNESFINLSDGEGVVETEMPLDLDGIFIRNGPNPRFNNGGGYHWFDGDGMLHAIRIKNGKVKYYTNTFVKTIRYQNEMELGRVAYPRLGSISGSLGILRFLLMDSQKYFGLITANRYQRGTANTALVYFDGRLLALNEASLPFHIEISDDGQLISRGYTDFLGSWNTSFTAHPKKHPLTGDLHFFGYSNSIPYLCYGVATPLSATVVRNVQIDLPRPVMIHDFAVTRRYAVMMDLPFVFAGRDILFRGSKFPYVFNDTLNSRFGVIPLYAESERQIVWFEAKSCFIFHTANAWEEREREEATDDNVIVLIAPRYASMDHFEKQISPSALWEYRFHLDTGETEERELLHRSCEFPTINPRYLGRKNRFVYLSMMRSQKIYSIVKLDLQPTATATATATTHGVREVAEVVFGEDRYGGETVFVPKKGGVKEDDGYLIMVVYDEGRAQEESELWVLDAESMGVVRKVIIPARIPYGFHGLFVEEEDIQNQRR